jgi:hypothetical protein
VGERLKTGQTSKKRPVFVNGKLCCGMAAGARHASEALGRIVYLWEIQRVLSGMKTIAGLEVIRADEPLPRKAKKPIQPRRYTAEARRKMSEARKGKPGFWRGKKRKDVVKLLLSQAKVGEKHPRAKLTENQVLDIIVAREEGDKLFTLSRRYGVSEALISRIKHGTRWRYLADDVESGNVFPAPHFA